MARTVVGVLRGGTSAEFADSLKTGASMLQALPQEQYDLRDILIDRSGMWHVRGIPADPARALAQVDVVLSALHGGVGESGAVQRILERSGVPFAGSRAHAANLSLDKARARETLDLAGVLVPRGFVFSLGDNYNTAEMARMVFAQFGPPYVVKPARESGGVGVAVAASILDLPDLLADVLDSFEVVLVEEYVNGREAIVSLVEGFRGEELYALPPARVVLPEGARLLDRAARESGVRYLAPSDFSHEEKDSLMAAARAAHRALGLSHFSRADIIVDRRGRPHVLEVNASPKLHDTAVEPQLLQAVGASVRDFLEHSITLARA